IERGREEAVAEGERAHRLARRRERDLHRGNVARLRRASQQPAVPDARRRGRDLEWTVLHQADRAGADRREVGCRVQPVREQLQIPMTRMFRLATAFVLISCAVARAEVTRVDVARRADVGISGYEKIVGTIHFAVDPKAPRNRLVVDLDKAPVNAAGLVEFSADLYILRPKATPGNGVALVDILNRGNKVVLNGFNRGGSPDPASENDLGDRFLMRFGYTIVWVGWEFDVAARPNAMRVHVPVATDRGKPITGVVQATFTPNGETKETAVTRHPSSRPASPPRADSRLRVRSSYLGGHGEPIPRDQWRIAGHTVTLDSGFVAGKTYEVRYRAANPPVAGLGFVAVRDTAAWLKHGADALATVRYAYGFGSSQSGRFLRSFLYEGFNTDEHDPQGLDPAIPHTPAPAR